MEPCYKMLSLRRKLPLFAFSSNMGMQLCSHSPQIWVCNNLRLGLGGKKSCYLYYKVSSLCLWTICFKLFARRADPCAVSKDNNQTPWQIAVSRDDQGEMLSILKEFATLPDSVKFEALSQLVYIDNSEGEWRKEQFKKLLESLPVDLVRAYIVYYIFYSSSPLSTRYDKN